MKVSSSKPGAIQKAHSAAKITSSIQLATFTHRQSGPGAGSRSGSRPATSWTELTPPLSPDSDLGRPNDGGHRARPSIEPTRGLVHGKHSVRYYTISFHPHRASTFSAIG